MKTLTCEKCESRISCKKICATLKKAITGRHQTAGLKKKTYTVDYDKICDSSEPLNSFQIDILNTINGFSKNIKDKLVSIMTLEEAINTLNEREQIIVQLFREKYKQKEIAEKLGVSQQRVDFLLKRIFKKLENMGKGSCKKSGNCLQLIAGGKDGTILN